MSAPIRSPARRRRADAGTACRRALAVAISLAGLAVPAAAGGVRAADGPAEGGVTWAVYAAPPFMIPDGSNRDTGVFDRIRRLLDDRLAGNPQPTLVAPFPRVLASLKDGAGICFIGGVKNPEREGFAVFSLPIAMFYPMRIVVHATQRARFDARAPLSLKALLDDESLRTSVLKDRSLGVAVDAMLRREPPIHVYSAFGEAFRMLLADRLDYLIEYSAIADYGAKSLGQDGGFISLPFAETSPPVFSRVMCPRTDWGRRLIARIDGILRVERPTPAYRRIVEAWTASDDLATIRDVYDRSFLQSE